MRLLMEQYNTEERSLIGSERRIYFFGDGAINVFDPRSGDWRGGLKTETGAPLRIDGLWGLRFGNGGNAGSPNTLFFSAGPNGEQDGLFGSLTQVPPTDDNG